MYTKIKNKGNLSVLVAEQIKQLIQQKKYKPGDQIPNETKLTELFGVSRPTIREAMKMLASQNFIEVILGKGTFVAKSPGVIDDPLGLTFINDKDLLYYLIEARQIIEPEVARLAAIRVTKEEITVLEEILKKMTEIMKQKDSNEWLQIELEFHNSISLTTRNPVISRILPIINEAISKTIELAPGSNYDHKNATSEHYKIFEAISQKDPEKSFTTMSKHIQNSYKRTTMALGIKTKIDQ